jgi:molybdopterin-guanine dinucleotide biosynthesis protein A
MDHLAHRPIPPFIKRVIILAGGKSSRMGTSKANLVYTGQTFIARICRAMGELHVPLFILTSGRDLGCANELELPNEQADFPQRFIEKDPEAYRGPLVALGSHAVRHPLTPVGWAFVTGCDTPLIDARFVNTLWSQAAPRLTAVSQAIGFSMTDEASDVGAVAEQVMAPFPAFYSAALLASLIDASSAGETSLFRLLKSVPKVVVPQQELLPTLADSAVGQLPPWFNVNTPAEHAVLTSNSF